MITDEMLAKAASQAAMKQLNHLPQPEQCRHQFSQGFERKIKKLTRKANHPLVYRAKRQAACFFLVLLIGFGCIMAVSGEARAAVFGWVKEKSEVFYQYFFDGEASSQRPADFYPSWLPEGYFLLEKGGNSGSGAYVFTNEQGDILSFSYSSGTDYAKLYVTADDSTSSTATVNGFPADIYLAEDDTEVSVIVWTDEIRNILFYVSAKAEPDQLIKIAENIIEK